MGNREKEIVCHPEDFLETELPVVFSDGGNKTLGVLRQACHPNLFWVDIESFPGRKERLLVSRGDIVCLRFYSRKAAKRGLSYHRIIIKASMHFCGPGVGSWHPPVG